MAPLVDHRLLGDHPGGLEDVVAHLPMRLAVGVRGGVGEPDREPAVAQRLQDQADLARRHRAPRQASSRLHRATEQLGGLGVGVHLLRLLARGPGIAEGAVVASGVQEVERQQLRTGCRMDALHRQPHLLVHPATCAVGQALVGHLTDQAVPEPHLLAAVDRHQELRELVTQLLVEGL
jgi:hypothetical protein